MNPAVAGKGSSFMGVVGYITHDVGKDTAERVDYVATLNMRTSDPEKAAKVMAWTAMHAAELKAASGASAVGRKTTNPVYHFSLNWEPGEKVPHAEMVEAAKSALKEMGLEGHEAVLAVHTDKPHQHIHVVVNRVHPETGRAVNPNADYDRLQRWAYQYEKDRGKVVCLDRAIRLEKDPELRTEYMHRRFNEVSAGKLRESKPRPQWEAEKNAPFPNSKTAKELRQEIAVKVRALDEKGRAMAERHASAWQDLKTRHAAERAELRKVQHQAYVNRRGFNQAAGVPAYSWGRFQADRFALRKSHTVQRQELKVQLKAKDAAAIDSFKAQQKAAWREFYRQERAAGSGERDKSLRVVTSTKVGDHTPEYRGHLAGVFKATHDAGVRKVEFAKARDAEWSAFYRDLGAQKKATLDRQQQAQRDELKVLRNRFDQARSAQASKAQTVARAKTQVEAERTALSVRQRSERAAIKAKHSEETRDQQQAWAALNTEREKLWGDYKAQRARQAAGQAQEASKAKRVAGHDAERSVGDDYAASRRTEGRDFGRDPGQDGGRDGSAGPGDTGRSLGRSRPGGGHKGLG